MKTQLPSKNETESSHACLEAAIGLLRQGRELLELVSDDAYCRRLAGASNESIGGHYRHCLDHFHCLIRGLETGLIDYDNRGRDAKIESDRRAALKASDELRDVLMALPVDKVQGPIRVSSKVHYERDDSQEVPSTLAREVMYVVAHGVHHFAVIAVMARFMDLSLPSDFGVAPSTLQHQKILAGQACALAHV